MDKKDTYDEDIKKAVDEILVALERVHLEVPEKVKQGMKKIEDLEKMAAEKISEIEETKQQFLLFYDDMDAEQRQTACKHIQAEYIIVEKLCNRKIKVACNVRKTIEQVKHQFRIGTQNFVESYPEPDPDPEPELVAPIAKTPKKKAARKGKKQQQSTEAAVSSSSTKPSTSEKKGSRLKKKKVVEEEQLWCYCREEKPGEMIFCEDPECTIQWFHFECINMTVAPEGDWFCKECLAKMLEDPFADDEPAPVPQKKTKKPKYSGMPEELPEIIVRTPKKVVEKKVTVEKPVAAPKNRSKKRTPAKKNLKPIKEDDESLEESPPVEIVITPEVASFEEVV